MKNIHIDFLKRRQILNDNKIDSSKLRTLAQFYEEKGRLYDAIKIYAKLKDHEALKRIMKIALHDGDLFLYRQLANELDLTPDQEAYKQLADCARKKGKDCYVKRIEKQFFDSK